MFRKDRFVEDCKLAVAEGQSAVRELVAEAVADPSAIIAELGEPTGAGDYPLYPNTAHSIELYAETEIESWDKPVRISLEEDGFFDGEHTYYIDGRQKEMLLIPRVAPVQ